VIFSAAVVAGQGLICGLTAAGWGYGIYRLCGRPKDRAGTFGLLCALAGWCAGVLLLQDLLVCDARLQWTAPLAGAVALAGLIGWWRERRRSAAATRYRLGRAPLLLMAAVYLFQSAGLIWAGPRDYYGYARQDQSNYVLLAEFLVEKPFSTTLADVGVHPWMAKGVQTKTERLGQSVANGYLSGVTGRDASYTYGAVSTFAVALAAAAVWGCLRAFGAPSWVAWLAGAWAGTLPALTFTHLEGYFSQICAVFCLVALAWAMRLAEECFWPAISAAVLVLGFLLCTYSEEYVVGLTLAAALLLPLRWGATSGRAGTALGPARLLGAAAAGLLGPWLLSAPMAGNLWKFIHHQTTAAARRGDLLAELQPRAGTWRGWNEVFLAAPGHQPVLLGLAAAAGAAILAAAIWAAVAPGVDQRARRSRSTLELRIEQGQRAALAVVPLAVLAAAVLTTRPVFPAYAFGKLLNSFAPLVVVLVGLAAGRWEARRPAKDSLSLFGYPAENSLSLFTRPKRGLSLFGTLGGMSLSLLVGLAAWSSWTKLAVVFRNGAGLATMNLPQARQVYRELDAHPERTYVLEVPNAMLNAWMAYHARQAMTYSAFPIGGIAADSSSAFMAPPPPGAEVWEINWDAIRRRAP
jgi:hypothetical protein